MATAAGLASTIATYLEANVTGLDRRLAHDYRNDLDNVTGAETVYQMRWNPIGSIPDSNTTRTEVRFEVALIANEGDSETWLTSTIAGDVESMAGPAYWRTAGGASLHEVTEDPEIEVERIGSIVRVVVAFSATVTP